MRKCVKKGWVAAMAVVMALHSVPVYALEESPVVLEETEENTSLPEETEECTSESVETEESTVVSAETETTTIEVKETEELSQVYETAETTQEETEEYGYLHFICDYDESLVPGGTMQLYVVTDVPKDKLEYSSSDNSIATVSSDGKVTAISGGKNGSSTIEIKVSYGEMLSDTCRVTIRNTISLNQTSDTMYAGEQKKYQLKATVNPKGKITWKSSNKEVASVDSEGVVKPLKAGKVTITASANGVSAKCKITVKSPILKLKGKANVYAGNTIALKAEVTPSAAVKWKSSDTSVAKVNKNGVVKGIKAGNVNITATANGITKTCKVTVKKPYLKMSSKSMTIPQGSSQYLSASAKPISAKIKWSSSNKKVVQVNQDGKITGKSSGTAKVYARISGAVASCKIKVLKCSYRLSCTQRTIMAGNRIRLHITNLPSAHSTSFYETGYPEILTLNTNGNECEIRANKKGKTTVKVSFYESIGGEFVRWESSCKITVIDKGIKEQNFSIATGTTKQLHLKKVGKKDTIAKTTWSSSAPEIASVNSTTGLVTGKKSGTTKIKAEITYKDGNKICYTTKMKVSSPKINQSVQVLTLNKSKKIGIKGINAYSNVTWKSTNSKIASISCDGMITANSQGKAIITGKADGKTLKCRVYVTNPQLKSYNAVLAPGETTSISFTGLSKESKVQYSNSNGWVASVDNAGNITAHNYGRCEIKVKVDGCSFNYLVEVAPQRAVDACRNGLYIYATCQYSQELRMSDGYYDCSSLVFKSYGRDSALLGGTYGWGPTAASMAQYMEQTGKVLSYTVMDTKDMRPGDLIFYGGADNNRYLGIYHVEMYYGGDAYSGWNAVMIARPIP